MVLPVIFARYRTEIETELSTIIDSNPSLFDAILRYHLGWRSQTDSPGKKSDSSKMVRATLCLVVCRALGGDCRKALPAAAAIELVHNFSLIHDDIEDDSTQRRHQATVWKLWGKAQAINAGDAVYALAHLALLRLRTMGIPPEKLANCLNVLDEACLRLCEGQYLDVAYENKTDITVEDYLNMVAKKTGALMAASASLGALIALERENKKILNSFYSFGKELGLVYQIRDDILGIWGSEKKTGKPTGGDIAKKKKTLPVIYGLQQTGQDREGILEVYRKRTVKGPDIAKVTEILDRVNARSYSQALAERYHYQALRHIQNNKLLSLELKEMADFFIQRDY